MASKGEQHQALHYSKSFAQEFKAVYQEDANGEKLTMKNGGFLVLIFHGLRRVFHGL